MEIKGKTREDKTDKRELYVGLAKVKLVAINPTRAELKKIMGNDKEDKEEKGEFSYFDKDMEGKEYTRISFWLYNEENDKYFPQSIKLYDEPRIDKTGKKVQLVNSVCETSWNPLMVDEKSNITDEPNEELIQDWFLNFTDKDKKTVTGKKKWRVAMRGEKELVTLVRSWLKMQWFDKDTEVILNIKELIAGDVKKLRQLIGSNYDVPFIILVGVRTSKDGTKKYQEVFDGMYLPSDMMSGIDAGLSFSPYFKGIWSKFVKESQGEYGLKCHHKLVTLKKYDQKDDPVGTNEGKPQGEPANNEY